MKFEGIYTPVLTPYDDNHAINFDAIEPMIEDLINSGVHGIVVAGTTGEYYTQDTKERLQVMKISRISLIIEFPALLVLVPFELKSQFSLQRRQPKLERTEY